MLIAVGRVPNSAWELGMAGNVFRESFLEKVTHKSYLEKFLEFQKARVGGRCFLHKGQHLQRPRGRQEMVPWRAPLFARAGVECETLKKGGKGRFPDGLECWPQESAPYPQLDLEPLEGIISRA